jgi:hypothetical protein
MMSVNSIDVIKTPSTILHKCASDRALVPLKTNRRSDKVGGVELAHRLSGLIDRCTERKATLTRSATRTRACSDDSPISKTHPVSVILRHISSGLSHRDPNPGHFGFDVV